MMNSSTDTARSIRTSFGFESTASEAVEGIDLRRKHAIVTGGASGIGIETARALAGAQADVTLAVRDLAAGERAAAEIIKTTGNNRVHVAPLELVERAPSMLLWQIGRVRSASSSTTPE